MPKSRIPPSIARNAIQTTSQLVVTFKENDDMLPNSAKGLPNRARDGERQTPFVADEEVRTLYTPHSVYSCFSSRQPQVVRLLLKVTLTPRIGVQPSS